MKKFRLRDYLPVLIMVLCAAIFGVLLATGVMDLDTVPQLVADRPVLAVLVVLGLYVLKGFSGVVPSVPVDVSPVPASPPVLPPAPVSLPVPESLPCSPEPLPVLPPFSLPVFSPLLV